MAKRNQGGFTLIELMIVVAIIGILAAVALPAYQDYVARAQAAEAVSLSSGAKTAIAEYYQINGGYPTASTTPSLSDLAATGTYSALAVAADGKITVTMSAASAISGKKFSFSPDATNNAFKWTCVSDADADHLPKGCTVGTP